ncbi:nicotinate-nucleotide adenylyltransferase [Ectothiorhodosinus mongolicus]|uniref:Probable nicotinate-nucleotide adenylyltransferase n=1 Tax=Ectothiorhodosinus mongolicus TaxID=233100 RepID=A0A1R3VP54_9GAMM|nr:nicotinate-nucleotide adenylyltransferase [Ectothiorhodosinus mongolicus]ULX56597.1 nicotinate-nucleotide adenylyltransferase [Ectothiorhodosinus mongolicus]SIT66449.1 nicotinate-nucleotide adenylyltransferase [Ectothiorhodosinus mongolicus]
MIGVLGGTFDPVHYGHLRPAWELQEQLKLGRLLIIPCARPAHRGPPVASVEQRLSMLRLALADQQSLQLDEREIQRPGPSYMMDTLAELRAEYGPNQAMSLIVGMDAFAAIEQWHDWQALLGLAHVVVTHRPGSSKVDPPFIWKDAQVDSRQKLDESPSGHILYVSVTQLDISASRIRRLLQDGHSPRFLLPDSVLSYIEQQRLYRHHETQHPSLGT